MPIQVELTLDVYIALKSANQIVFWESGKGPGNTRPNKFKLIGQVTLPFEKPD